jgi:hypothetical protein
MIALVCAVAGLIAIPARVGAGPSPAARDDTSRIVASAPGRSAAPDSAAEASLVLALARGIFPALSEDLSWDVVSARVAPWTITVRDSANPRWKRVQRGLRLALPSGPSRAPEHYHHHLLIDQPEVRGDTAVMRLEITLMWTPKPGCRIGSSMSYEVRSTRRDGHWGDGVVRADMDGLPGVCP